MKLSSEEIARFEADGYLFLPGRFSTEEAASLKAEADRIYTLDRQEVWRESTGVARTAFVPRLSATVVDPQTRQSLEKLALGPGEALAARGRLGEEEESPDASPASTVATRASRARSGSAPSTASSARGCRISPISNVASPRSSWNSRRG